MILILLGTQIPCFPILDIFLKKYIKVILKYDRENNPMINKVNIISKASKKIYIKYNEINDFYDDVGILILSTSRGILSNAEIKRLRIGGKILFKIFTPPALK
jgi:small subunit ribosomal protein S8